MYPKEQGQLEVHSSSQHPTETQHLVAEALGLRFHQVICIVKRMGGAFGGKRSQAAPFAVYTALVAQRTGRAARCVITKDDDMVMTGNRHPFEILGGLPSTKMEHSGVTVNIFSNGAPMRIFLPRSWNERCFCLKITILLNARITGRVCRTNIHPNTAFRGFGGPQGSATMEAIIEDIAKFLEMDPYEVRRRNVYGAQGDTTPYGQKL